MARATDVIKGCRDLTMCRILTEDTPTALPIYDVDNIINIKNLQNISVVDTIESETYVGDDMDHTSNTLTNKKITIAAAELSLDNLAKLRGHEVIEGAKYTDGEMDLILIGADDIAPKYGMSTVSMYIAGGFQGNKFFKVQVDNITTDLVGKTIATVSIELTATPIVTAGAKRRLQVKGDYETEGHEFLTGYSPDAIAQEVKGIIQTL